MTVYLWGASILLFVPIYYCPFLAPMVMAQSAFSIYWNMQLSTPATHPSSLLTASDISQGVNFGTTSFLTSNSASLNSYTGASGDNNAALACRTGPLNKTATGSSYFSFTISAVSGYKFLLQSIALGLRSTNSGPQTWSIYSSVDNFTTPIYTSSLSNNSSWVFQQHSISSSYQEVVAYRIYGFDGVGTAAINIANWRIDDLELSGQVVPATLPVHWLYTDLYLLNNRVMVAWATTWEENNLRYHVERSAEGESFLELENLLQDLVEILVQNKFISFGIITPYPEEVITVLCRRTRMAP